MNLFQGSGWVRPCLLGGPHGEVGPERLSDWPSCYHQGHQPSLISSPLPMQEFLQPSRIYCYNPTLYTIRRRTGIQSVMKVGAKLQQEDGAAAAAAAVERVVLKQSS